MRFEYKDWKAIAKWSKTGRQWIATGDATPRRVRVTATSVNGIKKAFGNAVDELLAKAIRRKPIFSSSTEEEQSSD